MSEAELDSGTAAGQRAGGDGRQTPPSHGSLLLRLQDLQSKAHWQEPVGASAAECATLVQKDLEAAKQRLEVLDQCRAQLQGQIARCDSHSQLSDAGSSDAGRSMTSTLTDIVMRETKRQHGHNESLCERLCKAAEQRERVVVYIKGLEARLGSLAASNKTPLLPSACAARMEELKASLASPRAPDGVGDSSESTEPACGQQPSPVTGVGTTDSSALESTSAGTQVSEHEAELAHLNQKLQEACAAAVREEAARKAVEARLAEVECRYEEMVGKCCKTPEMQGRDSFAPLEEIRLDDDGCDDRELCDWSHTQDSRMGSLLKHGSQLSGSPARYDWLKGARPAEEQVADNPISERMWLDDRVPDGGARADRGDHCRGCLDGPMAAGSETHAAGTRLTQTSLDARQLESQLARLRELLESEKEVSRDLAEKNAHLEKGCMSLQQQCQHLLRAVGQADLEFSELTASAHASRELDACTESLSSFCTHGDRDDAAQVSPRTEASDDNENMYEDRLPLAPPRPSAEFDIPPLANAQALSSAAADGGCSRRLSKPPLIPRVRVRQLRPGVSNGLTLTGQVARRLAPLRTPSVPGTPRGLQASRAGNARDCEAAAEAARTNGGHAHAQQAQEPPLCSITQVRTSPEWGDGEGGEQAIVSAGI